MAQDSCWRSQADASLHNYVPADKNPVDENERYWAVELDLEPFKAHFPLMTRPSSIGDGVRFLNRCRTLSHHPQMHHTALDAACRVSACFCTQVALRCRPSVIVKLLEQMCWADLLWDSPEQHVAVAVSQEVRMTMKYTLERIWVALM